MPEKPYRSTVLWMLSLALVAACGNDNGSDARSTAIDAATIDSAGNQVIDSAPGPAADAAQGINCGAAPCNGDAGLTKCCTILDTDGGVVSQACVAENAVCQGQEASCDGPEDCEVGDVCCLMGTEASCRGTCHDLILCHADTDCAADHKCCPTGDLFGSSCLMVPACPPVP